MISNCNQAKPNLYLVGFMGTGKTSVGRSVAESLNYRFLDSDRAVEEKDGREIRQIFDIEGEAFFRRLEKSFVERGHPKASCVVSCGGGLIAQQGMLEKIRSLGPVVCLLASPETVYERIKGNKKRPLLNVEDPMSRICELLHEREPIYKKAGTEVLTDGRTISDIASHVIRIYRSEARLWKLDS